MNTPPIDTTPKDLTPAQKELADLERQIREQRARSSALDDAAMIRRKRAQLETAKREADEKELLTDLEEEHGELGKKIAYTRTDRGIVVVKRSPGVLFHRWSNSKRKDADNEELVRRCLIHPTEDEFDAAIDDQPAIVTSLTNKLVELYGFRAEEEAGK
jgi:hypothetical protein